MSCARAPKGRLKCTGRTVHTKGRFFTLYADKAAKRATRMDCRDVFDSVVFFSKACWVGKKEDNPEEEPLPLPDSLQVGCNAMRCHAVMLCGAMQRQASQCLRFVESIEEKRRR